MGGNSSTRRVSFEADENDNITVVKGIRLSDNVIGRMREPSTPAAKPQPLSLSPPQKPPSSDYGTFASRAVNEEELRKRITEELALEQSRRQSDAHKRLEGEKTFVREEISKVLEREKLAARDHLSRAILREKAATEEERLKAKGLHPRDSRGAQSFWVLLEETKKVTQIQAKQLEEKERQLKKQDEYYKEQLARLEERSAQFYKVTTEQYLKASNEVEARFKRYEASPICSDLQGKVLQCYQQNPQQTLNCSSLASQYLHCVNSAKQTMLRRGG
ncbi:MICOS complex subunit MIC19 isoform X1 [Pleurodeles waltl]|uniref:MICOS complex subunit MIC19 isoform X1 n=1 Tax=Pleurodeles waltl TaxID=8319 RepID=UPI0037095ABC